jgi:hypothetical protein
VNNFRLEVSQTYRISYVAELPEVYTGTIFEFVFVLSGPVTRTAYCQCIAKPRGLREA